MRGMSKKNLVVGTAFVGVLASLGVAQSLMEKATGVIVNEALRQRKKIVVIAGRVDSKLKKKSENKLLSFIELTAMFRSDEESMRRFNQGISRAMQEILNSCC